MSALLGTLPPATMGRDATARLRAFLLLLSTLAAAGAGSAQTVVYYSVGASVSDLKAGTPLVSIAGGIATFSVAQPDDVGVGDEVTYGSTTVAYIASRASATVFTLRTAKGAIPSAISNSPVSSIRRAFNSLSAAETGSSDSGHLDTQDLVTNDFQLHWACYDDAPLNDLLDLAGWTTGPSQYIRIFTPTLSTEVGISQRHSGVAGTGFRIAPVAASIQGFDVILIQTPYVRIEGLEIDGSGLSAATYARGVTVMPNLPLAGDIRVDSTLIHGLHTTQAGVDADGSFGFFDSQQAASTGPPIRLRNNIIYDITASVVGDSHNIGGIHIGSRTTSYVYNNTVFHVRHTGSPPSGQALGIEVSAWPGGTGTATAVAANNYVGDVQSNNDTELAFDANNNGVFVQSANVSSDATATGSGSQVNQTAYASYFQSITTGSENLHLKDDSKVLWGSSGVDLSGDANAPVTTDIDGESRAATPDIGADELASSKTLFRSVGTNASDLNVGARTVSISGSMATFSGAMPDNVGVGDVLQYQVVATKYIALIQSRVSTTEYMVASSAGGIPQSAPPGSSVSVYRAYTSLFNWEILDENDSLDDPLEDFDTSTNLVADDRIMAVAAYGDGVDTTPVVINGWTTGPSQYIRIYTPHDPSEVGTSQRHLGLWDPTKYRLESGSGPLLRIEDEYVRLEGLQLHLAADVSNGTGIFLTGASGNSEYQVSDCIIRGNGIGTTDFRFGLRLSTSGMGVLKAWNNLFYDWGGGTSVSAMTLDDLDFTSFVYANTIVDSRTGLERISGTVVAKNNLVYNNTDNYSGTFDLTSTNNLSGPSQTDAPGVNPRNAATVTFAGASDFHLSLADTGARDFGVNLSGDANLPFTSDIDEGTRVAPWDIGADEAGTSAGAATLSSGGNRFFTVGSPPQAASLFTITEAVAASTITAANDLRIRIPAGFNMLWDSTVTSITLGGPQASKVSATLLGYEDGNKTAVIDVTSDFAPGDRVTVDGLWLVSFTAPSPISHLELEVGNDGLLSAVDDKTVAINPGAQPTISSDASVVYSLGAFPSAASPFTITEGTIAAIEDATDIRVRIPDGVEMTWDNTVTSISVSGTASGDVSTAVSYEDSDRTLVINVTNPAGFAPGTYLRVDGLKFANFDAVSPPDSLELEVDNNDTVVDEDDKTVAIDGLGTLEVLTATSTDQQVLLQWVNPRYGSYDSTKILRKRDASGCPSGPNDASAVVVYHDGSVGLGAKDSVVDTGPDLPSCTTALCNDVTYCYVAYVDDGLGGFSIGKPVKARPFDTSGQVKWAYSTGATTLSPPGLGVHGSGLWTAYQTSNDRFLHAIQGGVAGGIWPVSPDWVPFKMLKLAQHRPAIVQVPVGAASRVAYIGSQDGHVYAIDADTGALVWKSPRLGDGVQAAPAGIFTAAPYSRAYDLILVGSRNPSGPNAFYGLNLADGTIAWTFDNGGSGIGMVNGGAAMDYDNNRLYFASYEETAGDDTIWCLSFSYSGSWTIVKEWSDAIGNINGSPVLYNGKVYVGTVGGAVHAYDAAIGTPLWNQPLGDGAVKGFIFPRFGTTELFVSTLGKLHCLDDATSGMPCSASWPETGVGQPSTPLQVPFTTMLFVGSDDGNLYQLKADNSVAPIGITLGDGSSTVGAPSFDLFNNLIYVGTSDGVIYAVVPFP